jgi:serine/threonine-protein kinase
MGRVYKAYDLKLERHVALKVIHLETAIDQEEREERIARFRREARAIAKLNHPNIVSLYDYDEISGMLYMTMEYVDGPSIEQMLKEKKQVAVHEAAQIIRQACMALAYAHRNGTIHRDIKPSNIMLNNEDIVKVVDFGVAKILAAVETKFHTLAGMRLGSPSYMSPEQIEAKDIDGRTDIYSLGTVFYEMLAGVKPFTMNEQNNLSPLFYAILHADPPKLTLAQPEVPFTIAAIVEKMLAKKPEQRYQNAGEIIEAFNSLR